MIGSEVNLVLVKWLMAIEWGARYGGVKLKPNVDCFDNLLETTRLTMPRQQQKISGSVNTEHWRYFCDQIFTLSSLPYVLMYGLKWVCLPLAFCSCCGTHSHRMQSGFMAWWGWELRFTDQLPLAVMDNLQEVSWQKGQLFPAGINHVYWTSYMRFNGKMAQSSTCHGKE